MGILSLILALLGLLSAGVSGGGGGGSSSSPFIIDPPAVQEETYILGEEVVGGTDFGDALYPPYGKASHDSQAFDWLGSGVSQESSYGGSGWVDTFDDGVSWFPYNLIPGTEATIIFTATASNPTDSSLSWKQYVNIWVDWDQSRSWESTEQIVDLYRYITVLPGTHSETFEESFLVPSNAMIGTAWLRARLAHGDVGPVSTGVDYGECEDYPINVVPEPATLLLLSSGLFGLAAFGRAEKRKRV